MDYDSWMSWNTGDPSQPNYSILNTLDDTYKNQNGTDGKFQFKIVWPLDSGNNYNEWKQTTNPVTSTDSVSGYEGINIYYTSNHWGGIENGKRHGGNTPSAALDGSVDHGNWYYAIGSRTAWNGGIPGASSAEQEVEFYVLGCATTETPTEPPTPVPTGTPTETPTTKPPSPSPSHTPTEHPTLVPTPTPTYTPTPAPSEYPTSFTGAPTDVKVKGTYVTDCHCTACHFEIKDSGHEYKRDITSCAHECAWDPECQTVLHDSIKSKCFWYSTVNAQNTPVPVLHQSSAYNSLTTSGGSEFTCWYKTEEYDEPTNPPTLAPTAVPAVATLAPTQYPITTVSPTTQQSVADQFDSSTKGSSISLSNNNRIATSTNNAHSWNSVYGVNTHTSGTVVWYVNVTKLHDHTANYWEMVIGVAHTTTRGANVFINSQEGVGYIQENGDKTQSGSSPDHTSYGSSYAVGDVIGVHLNIDAQTLSFSKNGITEGTAYTSGDIVSGKTWRLAVMVGDEDDEVEIVG
jgi:hypothetical protein